MHGSQIAGMAGIPAAMGSGCPFQQTDARAFFRSNNRGNQPRLPAARDKDIIMIGFSFHGVSTSFRILMDTLVYNCRQP
jgi:hypothetical protein